MKKNVIILTSGLSGSSVLTGLIARAGYWTGDETHKKPEYETFENARLIELNRRLLQEAKYEGNYLVEFSPAVINKVAGLYGQIDPTSYRAFTEHCDEHRPWVWKDPRLWLTIRYWKNFVDLQKCCFIFLTRSATQLWVSATLRRSITTFRYATTYEKRVRESLVTFLSENRLPYLTVEYEKLISHPAQAIEELNRYLDSELTVNDLKSVYHKPLYRTPRHSLSTHVKAALIYLKNYSERLDVAVEK